MDAEAVNLLRQMALDMSAMRQGMLGTHPLFQGVSGRGGPIAGGMTPFQNLSSQAGATFPLFPRDVQILIQKLVLVGSSLKEVFSGVVRAFERLSQTGATAQGLSAALFKTALVQAPSTAFPNTYPTGLSSSAPSAPTTASQANVLKTALAQSTTVVNLATSANKTPNTNTPAPTKELSESGISTSATKALSSNVPSSMAAKDAGGDLVSKLGLVALAEPIGALIVATVALIAAFAMLPKIIGDFAKGLLESSLSVQDSMQIRYIGAQRDYQLMLRNIELGNKIAPTTALATRADIEAEQASLESEAAAKNTGNLLSWLGSKLKTSFYTAPFGAWSLGPLVNPLFGPTAVGTGMEWLKTSFPNNTLIQNLTASLDEASKKLNDLINKNTPSPDGVGLYEWLNNVAFEPTYANRHPRGLQ